MTRTISPQLRATLATLAQSPVEFAPESACFVRRADRKKLRGLTRILAHLLPVPLDDNEPPPTPKTITARARRSRTDPEPQPHIWRHPCDGTPSRLLQAAPSCAHALEHAHVAISTAAISDRQHGSLIDAQLQLYVGVGGWSGLCRAVGGARNVDPCVATLLDYLRTARLSLVASQLPIYSATMNVATAIDVLATDADTLRETHLLEIKASMHVGRGDANYERLRGRLRRTTLRGTPLSYYSRHQLQLWTMHHMLVELLNAPPTSARVLRVSPGVVRDYALNVWYEERAKRFVRAIGSQTGAHKRALKRKRETGAAPSFFSTGYKKRALREWARK